VGPAMNFWRSRTTLALGLTVVALVVPCGAWYIVGSREVRRDAAQIEAGPRRFATDTASQLAGRLQERLDALLEAESNRPFYHYQSLYHDPKGASEGASVVPSPLAQGPTDPLVLRISKLIRPVGLPCRRFPTRTWAEKTCVEPPHSVPSRRTCRWRHRLRLVSCCCKRGSRQR